MRGKWLVDSNRARLGSEASECVPSAQTTLAKKLCGPSLMVARAGRIVVE